jgi:hypothetical protein
MRRALHFFAHLALQKDKAAGGSFLLPYERGF